MEEYLMIIKGTISMGRNMFYVDTISNYWLSGRNSCRERESIVMLIFLLFSDQIWGGATASGKPPPTLPPELWMKARLDRPALFASALPGCRSMKDQLQ